MRILRRIAVPIVGAAVAISTLGVTGAQAGVRQIAPVLLHQAPVLVRYYDAPTPNLSTVANALQFNIKSVSSSVALPAGLTVTHPVDISISYPVPNQTQPYMFTYGNRWDYQFPSNNGAKYTGQLTVTLTEHVSATQDESYIVSWQPVVEPLYNISVSPLTFQLLDDCDWIGDSEIGLQWRDPTGVTGAYSGYASTGNDEFTVSSFARTYYQVGQSQNLLAPGVQWWEKDFDDFAPPQPINGANLASNAGYQYNATTHAADGQNCRGRLSYSVHKTLLLF